MISTAASSDPPARPARRSRRAWTAPSRILAAAASWSHSTNARRDGNDHDVLIRIEFLMRPRRNLLHRHQQRAFNARRLVLPWLAAIEQREIVPLANASLVPAESRSPSISVIRLCSVRMLLYTQALDAFSPSSLVYSVTIPNAVYPALGPALERLRGLALFMILAKEGIVTLVISLHRRRMRAQRDSHRRR